MGYTYAIGDIQGCFTEFQMLLEKIHFNPQNDTLWLVGDLVNRGPQSAEVLRFLKNLPSHHQVVLGNHDFHLLAVADESQNFRDKDTFKDALNAPDVDELLFWLRQQKLFHYDPQLNFMMVHAGIPPQWDIETTQNCAHEIEKILKSSEYTTLLKHIYGNEPNLWNETLSGWERVRYIINAFTRMRFVDAQGALDFSEKGQVGTQAKHLLPWFQDPHRKIKNHNIVFGHWAALTGITHEKYIHAVDTGCSWGYDLTALRLEDLQRFSVKKC